MHITGPHSKEFSLAWRIPWTEERGGFQSMGSQIDRTEHLTLSLHFQMLTRVTSHMDKFIVCLNRPVRTITTY